MAILFVLGNLLPSLGLLLILRGSPLPASWQSGELHDYATFLLSGRTAALFLPFILYAIACYSFALFRPHVALAHFWIRFGICSGIVLALHYCFVLGIVLLEVKAFSAWGAVVFTIAVVASAVAAVAVPWLVWLLLKLLRRYLARRGGTTLWIGLLTCAAPASALVVGLWPGGGNNDEILAAVVIYPMLVVLIATPAWMAAAYAVQARRVQPRGRDRFQVSLSELLLVFSWLAAYFAAWRYAIVQTLEAYAELPTEPPSGCYVATTAAQGHPRIVKSWPVRASDGSVRRANLQLAYLKCGELVLLATVPSVHRRVRGLYDRVGPRAARAVRSRWMADAAYFALKPLEWTVRLVLAAACPQGAAFARRLYR